MKKKLFWFSTIIYLVLILADGLVTYIGTPDLKLESNPLVAKFGLGWEALFIANFLVFAIFILLSYYALVKYKSPVFKVGTFRQYCSMLFFNRPDKFIWVLYKFPNNWKFIFACSGYAFIISAPVCRAIVVIEWLFYIPNIRINFIEFIEYKIPFLRFDLLVFLFLFIFYIFYWFYKEYKNNQKNLVVKGKN